MVDQYLQGINTSSKKYDYIFAGTGASASLLLLQLHRKNLIKDARVLLVDQMIKTKNDRTFCFWADDKESIANDLKEIISHSWADVILPNSERKTLAPLQYHHIASIDLYDQIRQLAAIYSWDWLIAPIDNISADESGPYIHADGSLIRAERIFDSRTPKHQKPAKGETHIFQSFVGWEIEVNPEFKDTKAFRIMDFSIEQDGFTQFMYVLPYSDTTALVEITRFGSEIIKQEEAELQLEKYIKNNFGQFKKTHIEVGCIPMSSSKIDNESVPGITLLGARNYNIKPSTGYAFKNMYNHACDVADSIQLSTNTELLNTQHQDTIKGRFAFYDSLLLHILEKQAHEGKRIFTELFQTVETNKILRFLDEKTSIREDISILAKLPWSPFLKALFEKTIDYVWFRPAILTLLSLLLLSLGHGSVAQSVLGYGLFFIGLITVGIPHGAVDHLLESGKWDFKKAPRFIFTYLLQAALMGVLWYISPPFALILFLGYSAWHFGQADGKQWDFNSIMSLAWGISVLLYILGTHVVETNSIVASIGGLSLPFSLPVLSILIWLPIAIFRKQLSLTITIFWLLLSSQLPLILAFGLYFIGQHSLTNWKHIRIHLNQSHKKIWFHSLPFHAGAWIILALIYFFWPAQHTVLDYNRWGLFFIFIACISLPHAIAMHFVYSQSKRIQ